MKTKLLLAFLALSFLAFSQKREEIFNHQFKASNTSPYYFVVTEKTDSGWHREAYYLSQKTVALQGTYSDEAAKIEHGLFTRFHPTRFLRSQGRYAHGKKEGLWLEYNEKGGLIDSGIYVNGHLKGVSFRWHDNGMLRDSLNFDGQGNGVQVSWDTAGYLASAGRWVGETKKKGRWNFYSANGTLIGTEEYVDGKKMAWACYDEAGQALDTALCAEKEAEPPGGLNGWKKFLENNLAGLIQQKASSREWGAGKFTVMIRFVVEKDGSLSEFVPLTQYGRGVENDVIRMLRRSPRWTPGRLWGKPVRSYHTQPVTFEIQVQ